MAFVKKTWKDRIVQYANRRLLTKSGGEVEQVTVTRDEGTISEAGDQFNASNMNDLENRVNDGFDDLNAEMLPIQSGSSTNTKDYIDTGLSGKQDTLSTTSGTITANSSGGWGVYGRLKKYGNIVSFYIDASKSSALDSGWNTIGTLQAGFRPTDAFDFAMIDPGSDFASEGKVNTDGTVQVYKNANSTTRIRAQATFII